jgi:CubicO group peptidase (beta-lactamase class C family)
MPVCVALLLSLSPAPPLRAAPVELESRIEALAQQLMQRTGVPGVVIAVLQRDQPVLVKGFGVRQIGTPEPVDAHTLFPLALAHHHRQHRAGGGGGRGPGRLG